MVEREEIAVLLVLYFCSFFSGGMKFTQTKQNRSEVCFEVPYMVSMLIGLVMTYVLKETLMSGKMKILSFKFILAVNV